MTKLLLPVKTVGLETPHGEIDTCHTYTHTHLVCAERIFTLGGRPLSCGRSELRAD